MPINTAYSSSTALAMNAAVNKLQADFASNPSNVALIQQDVAAYYLPQVSVRAYAGLAIGVAQNSDYNGHVANASIEAAYGDSSFGVLEAKVAYSLALQDWNQITNFGSVTVASGAAIYIPTIVDDADEHRTVFPQLGLNIQYWSAADYAEQNLAWFSSPFSYEMQGVSTQSLSFPVMTAQQQLFSLGRLALSGFEGAYTAGASVTNLQEITSDYVTADNLIASYASGLLISPAIGGTGLAFKATSSTTGTLNIDAGAFDSATGSSAFAGISNTSVTVTGASTGTCITNYSNGSSELDQLSNGSGIPFQYQTVSMPNGGGSLLEAVTYTSGNTVTAQVYGGTGGQDISGATVTLDTANLSYNVAGTGFTLKGQSSDTAWLGNGAQGSVSGIGTVGINQGCTATVSNANIVFGTGSSGTIIGSNNVAGLWGSGASFNGNNCVVTAADSLSSLSITGANLTVRLGTSDVLGASGTGLAVTGKAGDTCWLANGAQGSFTGIGTVGFGQGCSATVSNASLIFGAGSSGTVTGSNNSAGLYGSNISLTATNCTVTAADTLTNLFLTGSLLTSSNLRVQLGSIDSVVAAGLGLMFTGQANDTCWLANAAQATFTGVGTVGFGQGSTATISNASLLLGTGDFGVAIGSGNSASFLGSNISFTCSNGSLSVGNSLSGLAETGSNMKIGLGSNDTIAVSGTGLTVTGQASDTLATASNVSGSISGVGSIYVGAGETLTTSNAGLIFGTASSASITGSNDHAQFLGSNASCTASSLSATVAANLSDITLSGQGITASIAASSQISLFGNSGSISLSNGAAVSLSGTNEHVTGTGGRVTLLGTGSAVTVTGTGQSVIFTSANESAVISGGTIYVAPGVTVSVTGNNDVVKPYIPNGVVPGSSNGTVAIKDPTTGTVSTATVNTTGTLLWTSQIVVTDSQNRTISRFTLNSDGTSSQTTYYPDAPVKYGQLCDSTITYSVDGKVVSINNATRDFIDGTLPALDHSVTTFDVRGTQTWSDVQLLYGPSVSSIAGALTGVTILNHDGTSETGFVQGNGQLLQLTAANQSGTVTGDALYSIGGSTPFPITVSSLASALGNNLPGDAAQLGFLFSEGSEIAPSYSPSQSASLIAASGGAGNFYLEQYLNTTLALIGSQSPAVQDFVKDMNALPNFDSFSSPSNINAGIVNPDGSTTYYLPAADYGFISFTTAPDATNTYLPNW